MTIHLKHVVCPDCPCADCALRRQEAERERARLDRIRSTRRMLGWPAAVNREAVSTESTT